MKKYILTTLALLVSLPSVLFAQSTPEASKAWQHESEASIVQVGGNTQSESYSAKQKTNYTFSQNIMTASARYLQTKAASTETAKQWDASLRYEREFSEKWAAFIQHGAESDPYAGYVQRDNSDIGAKYHITKTDTETFFIELGYRHTKTLTSPDHTVNSSNSGRLYAEYERDLSETVSGKLWVEYLPNFTEAKAYLINYEPSINVMMSKILSLKVAYLVKYHNQIETPAEKRQDTTLTTALVAKF